MIQSENSAERYAQAWIDRLARWLPEQRPLRVFVHSNPLEALQHAHFHAACEAATRIRGARATMTQERYRELLGTGRMRTEDVAPAMERLRARALDVLDELPAAQPGTILLSKVRPELAIEIGPLVDGFLLRVLPPFLDLGSAIWPMPGRDRGLLAVVRWLASTPLGVPEPWLRDLSARLGADTSAMTLVLDALADRGDRESGWPHVIHEALFALPGYAGMIHRLEHVPAERPRGVRVGLLDYLALRLVIEELALVDVARGLFGRQATLVTLASSLDAPREAAAPTWSLELGALQDAFEEEFVRGFVGGIAAAQTIARDDAPREIAAQLLVCVDERGESLRRHVEEVMPGCVTYGSAGFFGVPLLHRAPLDVDENASCPAAVVPSKRVSEELDEAGQGSLRRARRWRRVMSGVLGDDASRGVMGGVLASFANFVRAPKVLLHLLFPALFVDTAHDFEGTRLRYDDEQGFTPDDRIALVENNLRLIGLVRDFAPFVLVVGHGSTGTNNQFASGYQCGACGGRRGGINARAFCAFANEPGVRAGLAARGIVIPAGTHFVSGEHDTALDMLRWFELERLPDDRRRALASLVERFEIALARNAKERSRRFADIPLTTPLPAAVARVRARCADFAETRPEYNHATNAACVIGRRTLTRGLFLDRRPFLVSYDASTDDDGALLQKIMGAPLQLCAGINLEYFFSTMDPVAFGCDTKLPHNVVGLLGVSNGADGDLRPGLWRQTTELHEPIRLVTLVEAEPELVARVLARLPDVQRMVTGEWIRLFACSPSGRGFFRFGEDGFVPYVADAPPLRAVASSLDACMHTRDHVAPCIVMEPRAELEAAQ